MQLNLQQIPRVKTITKEDFIKNYFKPQKPVVIECFIEDWPAYTKWNLDYIKEDLEKRLIIELPYKIDSVLKIKKSFFK